MSIVQGCDLDGFVLDEGFQEYPLTGISARLCYGCGRPLKHVNGAHVRMYIFIYMYKNIYKESLRV